MIYNAKFVNFQAFQHLCELAAAIQKHNQTQVSDNFSTEVA